jgi:hypothetical protein
MQRGEVQMHSTSIATFRSRNAAFIKSGEGVGITYLVPVDGAGGYQRSKVITEMPAFPDLYREVHGKMPSGEAWDAFNWLTGQIGELAYVGLAPKGTPPAAAAALRQGFEGLARDTEFEKEMTAKQGAPYSHINAEQGNAIFRGLADVPPGVVATLRTAVSERK